MGTTIMPLPLNEPQHCLPFDIDQRKSFTNFYPGKTEHRLIKEKLAEYSQQDQLNHLLVAQIGDGKTHLLQACVHHSKKSILIPCKRLDQLDPEIFNQIDSHTLYLDDIDRMAYIPNWEKSLLRLLTINPNLPILASSCKPIQQADFQIPDLASRLQALCPLYLAPLSEQEQRHALQQRAKKRGIVLSNETIIWLQKILPRDNHTLFDLLTKIDQISLSTHTKPNLTLLRKVLAHENYITAHADLPD